jgi:Zn-dependent protease with chaperone function
MMLAPMWMRIWMGARPFPPHATAPLRVAEFCRLLHIRMPSVLCISGNQSWHGAALVGWAPPARQLWVGQAVTEQLRPEELDMVILHELAHLRRGHCWWRMAALLLCGGCMVLAMAGGWIAGDIGGDGDAAKIAADPWQLWLERSALVVLGGTVLGALSWTSRRCELDADGEACRQASRICSWAADRPDRAAATLVSALLRMHGADADVRRWYWLHPSLARREQALLRRYRCDSFGRES